MEIQTVHPKGDQSWVFIGRTDVEAETPILWPPDVKSWLGKDPDAGKDWGQEEKGTAEDEMVAWHHQLNTHGFGWILGVGDGQGGLVCRGSWGHKESDTTERLNWTELLDHRKNKRVLENIYICFIDYTKAFDCVDHNRLWKILENKGIPDHHTCLLRNLDAGQEATDRTDHGTMDWFQIGKGARQSCILSPCLFNVYAEHIMRNAGLDEAQAGIKVARRNISDLKYADDTTLMAESKEELKSLMMKVKEQSEKAGLKFNIQKTKVMTSSPITSWTIDGNDGNSDKLYFLWLQNDCRWWLQSWN